jgi:hypothetical protein
MRLIDADSLKEKMATTLEVLKGIFPPGEQEIHLIAAFDTVRQMADDCRTIEAVPVVRCKDCRHSGRLWGKIYCDGFADEMVMIGEDDFCSRGERSEK